METIETKEVSAPVHHTSQASTENKAVKFIKSHKIYFIAAAIYLVFALINFWPVATHPASVIAGVGGDGYQSLWNIWFVGYSLFTLHHGIWSTSLVFYPIGASLIYETFSPLASLLAQPFTAVSLAFAYNVIFFVGFMLSGVGMFILAKYLTKNNYAAFIAGLIFSFSTFHITQSYGHLDFANLEWVPIAIYLLLRIIREDKKAVRNAILLGAIVALSCFTADISTGIIIIFTFIVIMAGYLIGKESRKRILSKRFVKAMAIAVLVTFILGIWAFVPILSTIAKSGTGSLNSLNDVQHNMLWSDDLASFFLPTYYNGILGSLSSSYVSIYHGDISETASYITYTAIILVLIGLWKNFKESRLWIALAAVFLLLALGPYLLVGGSNTGVPLPYIVYRVIPIFNTIREPGRFDMIVSIAIAVMAAFGVKSLLEKKGEAQQTVHHDLHIDTRALLITIVIAALFMVESNGMPLSSALANATTTHISIPGAYYQMANVTGNFSVLQLPILPNAYSAYPELYPGLAMLYQTASHKGIVGGYLTRENFTQESSLYQLPLAVEAQNLQYYGYLLYSSPVAENYTNESLLTMYNYDSAFVVLDGSAYNDTSFNAIGSYLYKTFGRPIYSNNGTVVFPTTNAISNWAYRSYVAYPSISYWNETSAFINGTYVPEWMPIGSGAITVFAPYTNASNLKNTIDNSQIYYINSTIKLTALSAQPQKAYIAVPNRQGNYTLIGEANLTAGFKTYDINVTMASGPIGNTYFFLSQYSNYPITVKNVSFSRRGG